MLEVIDTKNMNGQEGRKHSIDGYQHDMVSSRRLLGSHGSRDQETGERGTTNRM